MATDPRSLGRQDAERNPVPNDAQFRIDPATESDTRLVLDFINGLAEYEGLADEVFATEDDLRQSLFGSGAMVEAVIGYSGDEPVGLALFFHHFSTYMGRYSLYLEDLFVLSQWRGRGLGRKMMSYLAHTAASRNCWCLEWSVLDRNHPAIGFYRGLGAGPVDGWTTYRLSAGDLEKLALEHESTEPGPVPKGSGY